MPTVIDLNGTAATARREILAMQPFVIGVSLDLGYYPSVQAQVYDVATYFDILGSLQPRVTVGMGVSIQDGNSRDISAITAYSTYTRYSLTGAVGVTGVKTITFDDSDWLGYYGSAFDLQLMLGTYGYDFTSGRPITIQCGVMGELNESNASYSFYFTLPLVPIGTRITFIAKSQQVVNATNGTIFLKTLTGDVFDKTTASQNFPSGGAPYVFTLVCLGPESWALVNEIDPTFTYPQLTTITPQPVGGFDASHYADSVFLAGDLTSPVSGNTAVGGGSAKRFVISDGVNWKVI